VLSDPAVRERISEMFRAGGIGSERIDLRGWSKERTDHMLEYDQIDIALDSYPYHGTTTTCEAIWMGVPVVTLAGEIHARRVGASLLNCVGLERLVAKTPEEYIDLAIVQGRDLEVLSELRKTLRDRMTASPLTDGRSFARKIESAYRKVWQEWCKI